jgi:peptidyl-prolyl cis-trans isomerase C
VVVAAAVAVAGASLAGSGPRHLDDIQRYPVKTRIAIALIAVALVAACKKTPSETPTQAGAAGTPGTPAAAGSAATAAGTPGAPGSAPPAVKPVPAQLPEIVARVNGAPIDRGEFERAVKSLEGQAGGPVPPDRRDAIYRQLVDQLVALKLLSQESVTRKIVVPETEIEGRLAEVKKPFPNEQAFSAALAERQMTLDRLKLEIRQQLQAMRLVDTEIKPTVAVTDTDITDFYVKNPDKFQEPEAVHALHILIRTPNATDEAQKKTAKAEATAVLAELKKGGDFATLAKQHSQDAGSAANGGDLGWVPRGQSPPVFEQAAFALKPGQTSGVVESPYGYHIIKVAAHRDARIVPLQEVKPQVQEFLTQQQMQQKTEAFVTKLKAKAKIEVLM